MMSLFRYSLIIYLCVSFFRYLVVSFSIYAVRVSVCLYLVRYVCIIYLFISFVRYFVLSLVIYVCSSLVFVLFKFN